MLRRRGCGGSWARMLTQEAPIILLDEPVSNLDIRNQADTLSAVRGGRMPERRPSACFMT